MASVITRCFTGTGTVFQDQMVQLENDIERLQVQARRMAYDVRSVQIWLGTDSAVVQEESVKGDDEMTAMAQVLDECAAMRKTEIAYSAACSVPDLTLH